MTTVRAEYMHWAKHHPQPTWDLCGSNLLGCTIDDLPEARAAIQINGPNDEGYPPLLDAIARRYGVTPDRVAIGNGTSGANFLVCAAFIDPGDDVLVETPGYDPLFAAVRLLGGRLIHFERKFEDGYSVDPDRVAAALTDKTRLVIITNLHNPSGVRASDEAIQEVGRLAARVGARVLVDEVYLDSAAFISDSADGGSIRVPRPAATFGDVFISTSSLTKSYGLSGLRCGWVLGTPEVAERVRRARDIVDGVGAFPSDLMAIAAFEHLDRLAARARRLLKTNFTIAQQFLDGRDDLDYVKPVGGTVVFPRLRARKDAGPFVARLLEEEHVSVVPGRFFQSPAHFRLAFGARTETLRGGLAGLGRMLDRMRSSASD